MTAIKNICFHRSTNVIKFYGDRRKLTIKRIFDEALSSNFNIVSYLYSMGSSNVLKNYTVKLSSIFNNKINNLLNINNGIFMKSSI